MNPPPGSRDLVRIVLGVLLILLLIGSSLSIMRPFLPALIWATMIVVATWPLLLRLQRALGGRRSLAAAAMTALLFVIVGLQLRGILDRLNVTGSLLADAVYVTATVIVLRINVAGHGKDAHSLLGVPIVRSAH